MFPPGGWRFTEPKTGWKSPAGMGFSQLVDAIINHRLQNPRFALTTNRTMVENELDDYTCALLKNDPHWCVSSTMSSFPKPPPKSPGRVEAKGTAAGVTRFLANTGAGIKLWIEWFGDGTPVESSVAEARANICANHAGVGCTNNTKGNILDRFSAVAGREIMSIFNALHDLNLHSSHDKKLFVCEICDCPLKAKVWCPLPIIKKHILPDTLDKLPEHCWIKADS